MAVPTHIENDFSRCYCFFECRFPFFVPFTDYSERTYQKRVLVRRAELLAELRFDVAAVNDQNVHGFGSYFGPKIP